MEMCPSDLSLREVINVRHATAYHAMPLGNSTAQGCSQKMTGHSMSSIVSCFCLILGSSNGESLPWAFHQPEHHFLKAVLQSGASPTQSPASLSHFTYHTLIIVWKVLILLLLSSVPYMFPSMNLMHF